MRNTPLKAFASPLQTDPRKKIVSGKKRSQPKVGYSQHVDKSKNIYGKTEYPWSTTRHKVIKKKSKD